MTESSDIIDRLYAVIVSRKGRDPKGSYTASLLEAGPAKAAQKLGEEAIETAIAAAQGDRKAVAHEAADVVYHLLVTLAALDIEPSAVYAELARREGQSGHDEKASRSVD